MSEQHTHTPGPWVLENHGYKYIVSKPGDGYITREICRMDGSTMSAFAQTANARLIAAAPELLEALKDARRELAYAGRQDAHDRATAAIAKVEGEPAQ